MSLSKFTLSSEYFPVVQKISEALNRAVSYRDANGVYHSLAGDDVIDVAFDHVGGVQAEAEAGELPNHDYTISESISGSDMGDTNTYTWKIEIAGNGGAKINYNGLPYSVKAEIMDMVLKGREPAEQFGQYDDSRTLYRAIIERSTGFNVNNPVLTYTAKIIRVY